MDPPKVSDGISKILLYPLILNQKNWHNDIHVPYKGFPFNLMRQRCAIKTWWVLVGSPYKLSTWFSTNHWPLLPLASRVKMSQFNWKNKVGLFLCSPCQRLFHPEWKLKKNTHKSSNFQGSEISSEHRLSLALRNLLGEILWQVNSTPT